MASNQNSKKGVNPVHIYGLARMADAFIECGQHHRAEMAIEAIYDLFAEPDSVALPSKRDRNDTPHFVVIVNERHRKADR